MSIPSQLLDLASARYGGDAVAANDDFFAPKENLVKPEPPTFVPDKYTDRGKWMDGWETRRRRSAGHDWCVIRLGLPGVIRQIVVDTAFFRGNFPTHCWIEGCGCPPATDIATADVRWHTIVPRSELAGDTQNAFTVEDPRRFTHLRLSIYPDGGVARLRVFGEPVPDWTRVLAAGADIDLASAVLGAHVVDTSDRFFGEPHNMLMPYPAANMGDGWETKRRRGPGHDWAIVRLACEGEVRRVEVDTAHFKGNYPDCCAIEAAVVAEAGGVSADAASTVIGSWKPVLAQVKLQPDHLHVFDSDSIDQVTATHVRLDIFPDGGISRFRVVGSPTADARRSAVLRLLNIADEPDLRHLLADFCASPAWLQQMTGARPFASAAEVYAAADAAADTLSAEDWVAAFKHHPRIGERQAERAQSDVARGWSAREQSSVARARPEELAELAEANRAYQNRFGFVFLIRAADRSVAEMLAELRRRMTNDPAAEIGVAAAEHRKITRLRLEKLLG